MGRTGAVGHSKREGASAPSLGRGVVVLGALLAVAPAAAEPKKPEPARAEQPGVGADIQQFCGANAAALGDARVAWQTRRLAELEERIRRRIAELDAKKAEYEAWLRKRDDMLKQAADGVVTIYAKMRPEAAAAQLAAMDEPAAAAILARLAPRASGAILNEMEAGRAARLVRSLSGPEATDEKKS
ncbi:MotE family protein [Methylocella sp.]|uniref:MotE family protein n=1 Tax=Methylocella sp. TaxID=1978226 RepID=UPI0037834DBE